MRTESERAPAADLVLGRRRRPADRGLPEVDLLDALSNEHEVFVITAGLTYLGSRHATVSNVVIAAEDILYCINEGERVEADGSRTIVTSAWIKDLSGDPVVLPPDAGPPDAPPPSDGGVDLDAHERAELATGGGGGGGGELVGGGGGEPTLDTARLGLPAEVTAPIAAALSAVVPALTNPDAGVEERVRIEISEGLGRVRDPRLTEDQRWVDMPAGRFWRGVAPEAPLADRNEVPAGPVGLWPFRIQR